MHFLKLCFLISFLPIVLFFTSCQTEVSTDKTVQLETQRLEQTLNFPSLDSLPITANLYMADSSAPVIVLCHQARFNKFEYEGIAQKLNDLGLNPNSALEKKA